LCFKYRGKNFTTPVSLYKNGNSVLTIIHANFTQLNFNSEVNINRAEEYLYEVFSDRDKTYSKNSKEINVKKGKKYSVNSQVHGMKGKEYCAYFGVIFLGQDNKEKERKIKWLNDFSGYKKNIELVFKAQCDKILIIYRINFETPNQDICQFKFLPIEEVIIKEVSQEVEENFDTINNYTIARPKELTTHEESILEKNIIWVFGSPRSGTTWLATELLSFQTKFINEPHLEDHLAARLPGVNNEIIKWYDRRKSYPDYFFSDAHKPTWLFFLRKLILNRIYSQIQNLSMKIIIKSPGSFGASDIISECLPNSKVIILLRDGRDIIDSLLDARGEGGFMNLGIDPIISSDDRLSYMQFRAKMWINLIENLMKTSEIHSKNLLLVVKYEDLRNNALEELRKIYQFIEIDIERKKLEVIIEKFRFENIQMDLKGAGKFHRSASPGSWKKNFSEEEKIILEKLMGETLRKIGYN